MAKTIRLRRWQKAALDTFRARSGEDFLAVATPGAGKTTFALAAARQRGDRSGESIAICNLMTARLMVGQWQEVERIGEAALDDDPELVDAVAAALRSYRSAFEAVEALDLTEVDPVVVTDPRWTR